MQVTRYKNKDDAGTVSDAMVFVTKTGRNQPCIEINMQSSEFLVLFCYPTPDECKDIINALLAYVHDGSE